MATTIQIKRSPNVTAATTADLLEGELAYSYDKSNDGAGAKLYIEVQDSGGNEYIHTIGGKYYTSKVDAATSANTTSTLVARDALGSFAANVITANSFVGNIAASSAQKLTTARYINLGGDLQGNVLFDGTQDVTIVANVISNSVALGTDTTGDYVANLTAGSGISLTNVGGESANVTVALSTTGVTANTYGSTTSVPVITVDAYGRLTSAANATIAHGFNLYGNTGVIAVGTNGTDSLSLEGGAGIITNAGGQKVIFDLRTSGVAATTYGGTTNIPVLSVDQYGRITSASNAAISTSFSLAADTGTTDTLNSGDTLRIAGSAPISTAVTDNTITVSLATSGVTAATYGSATNVSQVVVDTYGRVTSASNVSIAIPSSALTTDVALGTQTSGAYVANLVAGTGISISGLGNEGTTPTITNSGVTGITGTANEVEVSASTGSITIGLPNNVTIGNDLTVSGNLNILGTATTVNSTTLNIADPLIYLAGDNYSSDLVDIGFVGNYYDGSSQRHAGLFRDASDSGKFKLFYNLQPEPTNTINTGNASFTIATLVASVTGGTVSGLTANIVVGDGGTGRGTLTTNAILYGQGTSAVGLATGSAYQVLQLNASGVPVFAGLDGGTY